MKKFRDNNEKETKQRNSRRLAGIINSSRCQEEHNVFCRREKNKLWGLTCFLFLAFAISCPSRMVVRILNNPMKKQIANKDSRSEK